MLSHSSAPKRASLFFVLSWQFVAPPRTARTTRLFASDPWVARSLSKKLWDAPIACSAPRLRFRCYSRRRCYTRGRLRTGCRCSAKVNTEIIEGCEIHYRSSSIQIITLDYITLLHQWQFRGERKIRCEYLTLPGNLNVVNGIAP